MKKILIVNKSFEIGGIESALVNLANELQKYCQVDLVIYKPHGPMRARLQEGVHVLPVSWRMQALGMSLREAIGSGNPKIIIFRVLTTIWTKLVSNALPLRWAFSHEKKLTGYDLAIAYHQEQRKHAAVSGFTRFVDQCVDARVKIAWLHYDTSTIDLDSAYNIPFYQCMDKVVCVSRSLMECFASLHPELSDKLDYCYNVIDGPKLMERSMERQEISYLKERIICFSACRLTPEKAIVRSIKALSDVFRAHPELMWYIAGDGVEKENILHAIAEENLSGQIILIGQQSNPYPYMRNADLVLNVSFHEATPMVFLEAKVLGVPVFATRTISADELLRDGQSDFICENSEEGIRETFQKLIEAPELLKQAKEKASQNTLSCEDSIQKILSW